MSINSRKQFFEKIFQRSAALHKTAEEWAAIWAKEGKSAREADGTVIAVKGLHDGHNPFEERKPYLTERYEKETILSAGLSDEATDVNIRTRADKVRRGNKNGETRFFNETVVDNALYLFTFAAGEHGSVSATVSGSVITSPYKAVYGTEISLSATPETGYLFNKWSDGVDTSSRTVTLTNDLSLTALFVVDPEPADYTNTEAIGYGLIQSARVGINAPLSDFPTSLFEAHEPINVKIGGIDFANVQFLFQKQLEYYETDDCYFYEDDDCELSLFYASEAEPPTYVFYALYFKFQLTYSALEGGTITVVDENGNVIPSGTMLYADTSFTVTATPAAGYLFDKVSVVEVNEEYNDIHSSQEYTLYGKTDLVAHFMTEPTVTLTRNYDSPSWQTDVSGDEDLQALFNTPQSAYVSFHLFGTWPSSTGYDSTSTFTYGERDGGAIQEYRGMVVFPDATRECRFDYIVSSSKIYFYV